MIIVYVGISYCGVDGACIEGVEDVVWFFYFKWYSEHRNLHYPLRRQRQMGIKDSASTVLVVLSSPGPALCSAASLRVPAAEHAVCTQLTAPPTLPRLILGLLPGWYALWQS